MGKAGARISVMAAREISVKRYVAERSQRQALINKGKSPAKRLLKARILLKADAGEAGEAWSDGQIIEALDTNASMVSRFASNWWKRGLRRS
jgi:hypothetical protein